MANPTAPQQSTVSGLVQMHGKPDRIALEDTIEPYGLLCLAWFDQKRILFVKPDGTRQTFTGVQKRI